jgi:hypothetical protein
MVRPASSRAPASPLGALAFAAALPLLLAACHGRSGPPAAVVDTVGGVPVVRNDTVDRPLGWTLRKTWEVGAVDGPDALARVTPAWLAVGGGDVFIMDRPNHRILSVDLASGHVVARFGHEGQGPFEFRTPVAIWARGDTVDVFAGRRQAVESFTAAGKPVSERPLDGLLQAGYTGEAIRAGPNGIVFPSEPHVRARYRKAAEGKGALSFPRRLIGVSASDTIRYAEMRIGGGHTIEIDRCGMRTRWDVRPVGAPDLAWSAAPWGVSVNAGPAYAVDVFGARRMRVTRRFGARPLTRSAALGILRHRFRLLLKARCALDLDKFLDGAGKAKDLTLISAVSLSPGGRLWVRRSPEVGSEIDVFGRDGGYLGTLPSTSPYPELFAPDGSFIAIRTDSLGVQYVDRYVVEETGGTGG